VIRCWISFAFADGIEMPWLSEKSGLGVEDFERGAYGARQSIPLHCHMTTPRQYSGPVGRVLAPGNSARKAVSEEFVSAAMLPGESRSEKPTFGERKKRSSNRNPVLIRGNKRKKSTTSGKA
jgi:hypothetical protein